MVFRYASKVQRLLFILVLVSSSLVIGVENWPYEVIQKIGQHIFCMELHDTASKTNKEIFNKHCNLFDRIGSCWIDNFAATCKKMQCSLNNPEYNKRLEAVWYQERTVIPYFPYEIKLLKHVIAQRTLSCFDHQVEVVNIASNFFAHEKFFLAMFENDLCYLERTNPVGWVGDNFLIPRGNYSYGYNGSWGQHYVRKELLCDWPFLFVIFYSKMLPYYAQSDEIIQKNIDEYIKKHTPFGNNGNFTIDWLWNTFIKTSLLLRDLWLENKDILSSDLISFINCYSELNIKNSIENFACFGNTLAWKKLSEKQKILVFYYRNALHLNLMIIINEDSIYAQDCLYLIEKWLKKEYNNQNCVIIDDDIIKPLRKWDGCPWRNFLQILPFLWIEIEKNKLSENCFFEVIKMVLNPNEANWRKVCAVSRERNGAVSKEDFKSSIAQQLLQLAPSYHLLQKLEITNQITTSNEKILEQDNNNLPQKELPKKNTNDTVLRIKEEIFTIVLKKPDEVKEKKEPRLHFKNRIRFLKTVALLIFIPLVYSIVSQILFDILPQLKN